MKVCPACGAEYADDAAFCARDRTPLRPTGSGQGLVGQVVGERYQVERRLGEGGMGQVYLARHILMGRLCALKVMAPAVSTDADALSRFNREATNASRISHPNVCAVYDFGLTSDGLVYLAMELVEGKTLGELAGESGPMPVSRAGSIVMQAAAGLRAAHDLGIVHRDLKLDNIMVSTADDRDTVKLVDFGIAKSMEGLGGAAQRVTKTGFVVGTPEYMAPEQLAGDPLDGRADQYALALVFYRLVTGRLPFDGDSAQETMVQRLTTPPRTLAAARPETRFPEGLQPVLDTAFARHPRDRFPTVTDFAQALASVIAGDAAPTRVLGRSERAIPPTRVSASRSRRRGFAVAGAVVVVGAMAVLISVRQREVESTAPQGDTLAAIASEPESLPDSSERTTSSSLDPVQEPARPTPVRTAIVDTQLPDLEDLDSPDRRQAIIRNEHAIYRAPGKGVDSQRRASAAAILSQVYYEDGISDPDRRSVLMDSARLFARRAWELRPTDANWKRLRAFGDTVPR